MTMYRLRRIHDKHILCSDGEWRPESEIGGLTGHGAKRYKTAGGAGGKASSLPFLTKIEEIND